METSIVINLIFAFILVVHILKPKIKELVASVWHRHRRTSTAERLDKIFSKLDMQATVRATGYQKINSEINHIKGQMQEALQELKKPQSFSVPKDPLIVDMHGDIKALFERLNMVAKQVSDVQGSVEYLEATVKAETERNTAKLYSEGLAGLAKASSAVLERQAKVENLLENVVNHLTQRAQ